MNTIDKSRVAPSLTKSFAKIDDPLEALTWAGYYAYLIDEAENREEPGLAAMYRSYQGSALKRYRKLRGDIS